MAYQFVVGTEAAWVKNVTKQDVFFQYESQIQIQKEIIDLFEIIELL